MVPECSKGATKGLRVSKFCKPLWFETTPGYFTVEVITGQSFEDQLACLSEQNMFVSDIKN